MTKNIDPEKIVREIKRKTRRKFSAEEKIRIVLEGLRGEETIPQCGEQSGKRVQGDKFHLQSERLSEASGQIAFMEKRVSLPRQVAVVIALHQDT